MVFHDVDLDKDGRLNLKEFTALMKVRGDDINKELGADNVWNYTEA